MSVLSAANVPPPVRPVPAVIVVVLRAFSPRDVDTVVLKLASSPKAAASSLRVSKAAGAESTRPDTCAST